MKLVLLTALGVGGATVIGSVLGFIFKTSLHSGVFAMLGGLILVPVISLLTQKTKPHDVDGKFAGYDAEVTVSAKRALEEK